MVVTTLLDRIEYQLLNNYLVVVVLVVDFSVDDEAPRADVRPRRPKRTAAWHRRPCSALFFVAGKATQNDNLAVEITHLIIIIHALDES